MTNAARLLSRHQCCFPVHKSILEKVAHPAECGNGTQLEHLKLTALRLLSTITLPKYKYLVCSLPLEIIPPLLFTVSDLYILACGFCEDLIAWLKVCAGVYGAGVAEGKGPVVERSAERLPEADNREHVSSYARYKFGRWT